MTCVLELLGSPKVTAILGAVIGGIITYIITTKISKKTEFNQAAAVFRTAFADEIRELKAVVRPEDMGDTFVQTTLTFAEAKHGNACILFRPYLSDKRKRQFDQAWEDYLCPGGNAAEQPRPFSDYYEEAHHEIPIKLALEKLDRLMEFGKPK